VVRTAAGRQLPTTLTTPPTYRKVNPADSPILILAAHSDTLPLTVVDDFADTVIAQRISQITGVAQVTIGGEQKPAIRVQVDPAKLQTRGLTLEDVRAVLGIANTNAAKGSINGAQQSFTIAANDQLTQAEEYNDVIIAYRNGNPVRLDEVSRVFDGIEDDKQTGWFKGERAIMLPILIVQDIISGTARIGARTCSRMAPATAENAKPAKPETMPPTIIRTPAMPIPRWKAEVEASAEAVLTVFAWAGGSLPVFGTASGCAFASVTIRSARGPSGRSPRLESSVEPK